MDIKCQIALKNNPYLSKFLRENSFYYKYLNRDSSYLQIIEEKMKEAYKMRTEDKLENLGKTLNTVNEFIKILY